MINIDKVSCLCLDTRWPDRKDDIINAFQRLQKIYPDIRLEYFLAGNGYRFDSSVYEYVDKYPGDLTEELSKWGYGRPGYKHHHWNALQCHKKMIRRAKEEGLDNILILEDDAYLTDRFEEIWSTLSDKIPVDYNLLYLGWWIGNENDEFNKTVEKNWQKSSIIEIGRPSQLGGLHGALISSTMFDLLLSLPDNNPIDCQLNLNNVHKQVNSYFIAPKIIHTRSCMSICEGSVINRNEL